jgi:hypothetical protein
MRRDAGPPGDLSIRVSMHRGAALSHPRAFLRHQPLHGLGLLEAGPHCPSDLPGAPGSCPPLPFRSACY